MGEKMENKLIIIVGISLICIGIFMECRRVKLVAAAGGYNTTIEAKVTEKIANGRTRKREIYFTYKFKGNVYTDSHSQLPDDFFEKTKPGDSIWIKISNDYPQSSKIDFSFKEK